MKWKLYAYFEIGLPEPGQAIAAQINEVELEYPELWGALHLGRHLASAGWKVIVTEELDGLVYAQFTSDANFVREEQPYAPETLKDA